MRDPLRRFGIEADADKIGGTAAAVVGVAAAAHAGVSAIKRARQKGGEN